MAPEELGDEERDADRDHDPGHEAQDLVGPLLQLGADQSELPGLSLEPPRIGHLTHPGRPDPPRAGDREGPRQHRFAGGLGHRLRLTGQEGLVDFETLRCQHLAVDGDLVAPTYLDHIVQHDLFERDVEGPTRADDVAPRSGQHGQPIERPLRADLLEDPDRRVGHEDDAEERILRRPNHHGHDEQGPQDGVETSEHVGPHDLTDRAPGGRLHTVGLAGTNRSRTCASESPTDASSSVSRSPDAEVAAEGTIASGELINAGAGRSSPMSGPSCWRGTARRPVGCLSLAYLPLPPQVLLGPNDLVGPLGRTFGPGDVEMPGSR